MYSIEPMNCLVASCQTTVNDRFRLGFAQAPDNTKIRIATAIGCPNFSEKLGPDSLTEEKLREAQEQNAKFVVLEPAYDNRLQNDINVITYDDWFTELNQMKNLWTI